METVAKIEAVKPEVKKAYNKINKLFDVWFENVFSDDGGDDEKLKNDILLELDQFYVNIKNAEAQKIYNDMISAFQATDSDILRQEIQNKTGIQIIRG